MRTLEHTHISTNALGPRQCWFWRHFTQASVWPREMSNTASHWLLLRNRCALLARKNQPPDAPKTLRHNWCIDKDISNERGMIPSVPSTTWCGISQISPFLGGDDGRVRAARGSGGADTAHEFVIKRHERTPSTGRWREVNRFIKRQIWMSVAGRTKKRA